MRRSFVPAEGSEERAGWDHCLDLPPGERRAALSTITAEADISGRRAWVRGWLDAWETFRDSSWGRIRSLINKRGAITDPRNFQWEGCDGADDPMLELGRKL